MLAANLGPFSKGVANVALNSLIGYQCCKFFKTRDAKDTAITLAIDSTLRILAKHWFSFRFGKAADNPKNMVHFSFLLATALIQPISVYLAKTIFQIDPKKDHISLFGHIALSWKINMMIKDIAFSSGLVKW